MTSSFFTIADLEKSPLNARRTHDKAALEELKASIIAHGLLQNLTLAKALTGKYQVVAGERRRAALMELLKEEKIPADYPVPCEIVSEEKAAEISLAENTVRQAMHPADEFEAFASLVRGGMFVEQVALRFGVTEKHVEKRMRLARVAPEILKDFRAGAITQECVMAFAVSDDHNAQRKAYKAAGKHANPSYIRNILTDKMESSDGKIAKFVGVEAYQKAKGNIREDLFKEESFFEDVPLLHRLAQEKLDKKALDLKKEGWSWVETGIGFDWSHENSFGRTEAKTKEQKALAGCLVSIKYDGAFEIRRGMVRPADKKKLKAADGGKNAQPAKEEKKGLSESLRTALRGYRLQIARVAIAENPAIAADLLIFKAACEVIQLDAPWEGPDISFEQNPPFPDGDGKIHTAAGKRLLGIHEQLALEWLNEKDEAAQFAAFRQLSGGQKSMLLAYCTALTLKPRAAVNDADAVGAYDAALALSEVDVSEYWRPTSENFLGSCTREQLVDIGGKLFGKPWADKWTAAKKPDLVKELHQAFADPKKYAAGDDALHDKLSSWLPEGMTFALPEKKAEKPKKKRAT